MIRTKIRIEMLIGDRSESESGTAAIEFGLAIPLLLIMLMGIVELGCAMYESMQVHNSVEVGALYAAQSGGDLAGTATAVVNATGTQGITAAPAPVQFCGCPSDSGIVTSSCSATCANGNTPGTYVRVSASLAHQTILPYPGLPLPTTMTAQSTIRLN